MPTPRAITEQVNALNKSVGLGPGSGADGGTPKSTKRSAPSKTPSSSAKRSKHIAMSHEDDSEDEKTALLKTPFPKREGSALRGKAKKTYTVMGSDDDDLETFHSAQAKKVPAAGRFDSVAGSDSLGNGAKASKLSKIDYFSKAGADDSDDDNYAPFV